MEVFGLVVAVGSTVKAAVVAVKFASTIRQVAKKAGAVGQNIERASLIFQTFGKAIEVAEISMRHHCPRAVDNPEVSPAIKYMKENNFLESLESQSCMIRNEILAHEKVIWSVITEWGPRVWREFKTSWNWVEMEQQIMKLHPHMESIKSTVNLTLQVIILEVAVGKNKRHPSSEQEKEILLLKTHIVELIDEIRHLRKDFAHIRVPVSTSNSSGRSLSPQVDLLKVICHLANSLVEREAVPTKPPESFSFKEAKRNRQYRRRNSRQFPSNTLFEVPAPVRDEQVVQPRSSDTISPGPRPTSPRPQKTKNRSPHPRSSSPYKHKHTRSPSVVRLRPVGTTGQDNDIYEVDSRSSHTSRPRQTIVTAKEVPKTTEDHSTGTSDTQTRISRVGNVVEPENPPKNETPTLELLNRTESAQDARGEINNTRARRARRKQRQSSATVAYPDISARYANLKPRPRPRSPPESVEEPRGEIEYNPARSPRSSTTADRPNGTSGSETLKLRSGNSPINGVIDHHGVGDIDHDTVSHKSVPNQKQNTQLRPLGIRVQTEPTPPQTPISPTQPSPILASSPSASPSPSRNATNHLVPRPCRQPPGPPDQATSTSEAHKTNIRNEIETAYLIDLKTLKKTPFEVYIDQKQVRNLMTLSCARKLGIGIKYQTHWEEFPYHGTKIALVGRAKLLWSAVPGNTLVEPRSVEIIVCEDSEKLEHSVIFGKWFIGARKNLNREEAKEEEGLDVERDASVGSPRV